MLAFSFKNKQNIQQITNTNKQNASQIKMYGIKVYLQSSLNCPGHLFCPMPFCLLNSPGIRSEMKRRASRNRLLVERSLVWRTWETRRCSISSLVWGVAEHMPEGTHTFLLCLNQVKTNRSSVRLWLHLNATCTNSSSKHEAYKGYQTLPKLDDFFNQRDLKVAWGLPCINVVCFWRQLLAWAVTARWGTSARAQQRLGTAGIRNQSYFHLGACNSAECSGSPVPTPTLDTHMRAVNVVLAPPALMPSWAPVWVARRLAGHCSAPGPPHHASVDIGVKSSETTVPHAKCALRVVWFTEWNESSKGY